MTAIVLTCPTWCQDTERHDATDLLSRHSTAYPGTVEIVRSHGGPSFGPFHSGGDSELVTGALETQVWIDPSALPRNAAGSLSPAALRQIAADALAAAEWLEANR